MAISLRVLQLLIRVLIKGFNRHFVMALVYVFVKILEDVAIYLGTFSSELVRPLFGQPWFIFIILVEFFSAIGLGLSGFCYHSRMLSILVHNGCWALARILCSSYRARP